MLTTTQSAAQITTKDLARVAGVSLATVDRVLNDRPNVSRKARGAVDRAIAETGFVRNSAAASLARNRVHRIRFMLPADGGAYLDTVLKEIEATARAVRQDMTLVDVERIDMRDPHAIADRLSQVTDQDVHGLAIMAPQSPQVRDAVARLDGRGVRSVQFLNGESRSAGHEFVGADNFAAGATAARIVGSFLRGVTGAVSVIADTMRSPDSVERRLGFDRVMHAHFPALTVLPSVETRGDAERADAAIGAVMRQRRDIVGVYVIGAEAAVPLAAVAAHGSLDELTAVAHERTAFTEEALRSGRLDAVIAQDPGHAVRSATRILRARLDNREPIAAQERIRNEVLFAENL